MKCYQVCKKENISCPVTSCRYWIDHKKSLNCTFGAIENAQGPMKLEEIGNILNLTSARIKQIEGEVFKKLKKSKHLQILQ